MQTCSGGAAVRAAARRVDVQRAAEGLRVFDEMRAAGVAPDATTKALLVKSLWREGKLREAALVEERCEELAGGLPEASPLHKRMSRTMNCGSIAQENVESPSADANSSTLLL